MWPSSRMWSFVMHVRACTVCWYPDSSTCIDLGAEECKRKKLFDGASWKSIKKFFENVPENFLVDPCTSAESSSLRRLFVASWCALLWRRASGPHPGPLGSNGWEVRFLSGDETQRGPFVCCVRRNSQTLQRSRCGNWARQLMDSPRSWSSESFSN